MIEILFKHNTTNCYVLHDVCIQVCVCVCVYVNVCVCVCTS